MKECSQTLCFQLKCNCSEQEEPLPVHQTEEKHIRQDIYSKFAQTLEAELRNQHQKYTAEVDQLSNQVFNLKNTVLRLELRNKKDNEAHQELRRQYNLLLQKAKDKEEPRIIKQVEVIQRVKQVLVEPNNEDLLAEIRHWRNKAEEGSIQFQKMRMDRDLANEKVDNLKEQLQRAKRKLSKQQCELQELRRAIEEKDRAIEKLNNHIVFLKNNKEVVFETKHLFPEFKPPEKVRTETKVQTIYIEKPVERPVFVEIEKRVKEFVQPDRPIVNRIISCPEQTSCHCQEQQYANMGYRTQIGNLQTYIDQLEHNITSFKSERQHLVDVIGAKNSELNSLEAKMRLFGNTGATAPNHQRSTVNVVVSRHNDHQPTNQKIVSKPEKYSTKK